MTMARKNFAVLDFDNMTVVDGATVTVRRAAPGLPLAALKSNRAGTASMSNPYVAADGGDAGFFVVGGAYNITATKGAFSRTWYYEAVGKAAESDISPRDMISVTDYEAAGDGSADDTDAINTALQYAYSVGRPLYIPSGTYMVRESSTGSGYALLNPGVSIYGDGAASIIAPLASMPNTADFMRINPATAVDIDNLRLHNFVINPGLSGVKRGKRGIYFLIDGVTNVSRFHMDGVYVTPGNDESLCFENNPALNAQGCPSNSLIERCAFWEGVHGTYLGDNFIVRGPNIFRSTAGSGRVGLNLYMTDAAGVAGHMICQGGNFDCDGGAIKITQGREAKIIYNNIEQSAGAGSNGSVIDIDGSSGSVDGVEIRGNHVGIFGTATVTKAIRLGVADSAIVDGNVLKAGISIATGISISGSCDSTTIGINDISGFTTPIVDGGTGTGFLFRSAVQSAAFAPMTNDGSALGNTNRQWSDLFLATGAVVNFNNGDVTITHVTNLLAFAGAGSYAFDATIYPTTNDGASLGSSSNSFSDLFLASGAVVNFNNGDVTITHSANLLAFAGAGSYAFDATIYPTTNDGASLGSSSNSFSDLFLASGGVVNFNNGDVTITHAANALALAGAANGYTVDAKLYPATNDGAALGDTTHNFSDIFLATGAVINYNAGNVTLTHSSGLLTLSGALTVSGNVIGSEVFAGTAAFGYGVNGLYSIAAGAGNSYMFWGNATNSERARLQVTNARDLYFSLDNGATGHLYVDLTHINIPMTTDSTGPGSGAITTGGGIGAAKAIFGGTTLNIAGVASLASAVATPAGGSTSARLLFGTTAGFGIYFGSGAPTVSAAAGSLYIRTDNAGASLRLYSNTTGSNTWAAITSA